jgi:hypothetical protein
MKNWTPSASDAIKAGVKESLLAKYSFTIRLVRRILWTAQEGRCGLCGGRMKSDFGSPKLTLEHVWPQGNAALPEFHCTYEGNTMLAHASCNIGKGNRRPNGCELLMLFVVNRRLGYKNHETALWDTP